MKSIIECGMFIGINGCSLKTSANLSVIGEIPIDRLLIETDSPWCEIRSTHASYPYVKTRFDCKKKERWESGIGVKGRNEPRDMIQVLEVVAGLRKMDESVLAEQLYINSCQLFKLMKD
jgi:TatD DNase family protein